MNVLITGVSSGLGKSLKDEYLDLGYDVYGISRSDVDDCNHIMELGRTCLALCTLVLQVVILLKLFNVF